MNGTILKHVDNNPYLGLLISKDLKWATHIDKSTKKPVLPWASFNETFVVAPNIVEKLLT